MRTATHNEEDNSQRGRQLTTRKVAHNEEINSNKEDNSHQLSACLMSSVGRKLQRRSAVQVGHCDHIWPQTQHELHGLRIVEGGAEVESCVTIGRLLVQAVPVIEQVQ